MLRRAALLLVAASVLLPTAVAAQWSASASGPVQVSAATLVNATGFATACAKGNPPVTLSWTPTSDTLVEHYVIVRRQADGTTTTLPVVARSLSTTGDSPPRPARNAPAISYTYSIRAASTAHTWTTPALAATTGVSLTSSTCTAG